MGEKNEASALPTYSVAFGQLQDLVRTQTSIIVQLQYKAGKQNDSVTKEDYDDLKQKLETETISHLQTKSKLLSKEKELQFALSDIHILKEKLEKEKRLSSKICSELQIKAEERNIENSILLEKCTEMQNVCGFQGDILTAKDVKINDLKARLAKQSNQHRMAASEAKLKLQQERFLNKQNFKKVIDKEKQQKSFKTKYK